MMNYVWLGLVAISVIVSAFTGNMENLTTGVLTSARTAVDISLGLIGVMALWLGVMKIAEKAGLISILARLVKPAARFLFPDVPQDHPAIGAITLNLSASWLGLGNAATPFGIKAMEELQTLNPNKDTATNAMIMFLGLNTASITLVPMTMIAVRTTLGAANPVDIIGPTIFASLTATLTAILTVKLFVHFQSGGLFRFSKSSVIMISSMAALAILLYFSGLLSCILTGVNSSVFKSIIMTVSNWTIPLLLLVIPVFAFIKKVNVYEELIEGAKEGFQVAVRIIPFLVAILVAIGMFRESGALAYLVNILTPVTNLVGMPAETLPAALMRPLSGSGTLGIITELLKTHGADSFIGRFASTIYGCTETTFYVIAVYFGAVQIKKTRFAVPAGLIADLAGVLAALFVCRILFPA